MSDNDCLCFNLPMFPHSTPDYAESGKDSNGEKVSDLMKHEFFY